MSKLDTSGLHAGLGEKVLRVLDKHQTLPSWGMLAGQAVSSALDEVLGLGDPVYNDIDWFVSDKQWEPTGGGYFKGYVAPDYKSRRVSRQVRYSTMEEVYTDSYERTLCVAERHLYSVAHACEDGLLNKVAVSWAYDPVKTRNRALDLIRVFDINSVQVGVDLASGLLTWTPAYEEFLRSRQLKLLSTFTPVQSLLRFLKKTGELKNVYANKELALDLVTQMVRANEGLGVLRAARVAAFAEGKTLVEPKTTRKLVAATPELDQQLKGEWVSCGDGLFNAPLSIGKKYRDIYERFADELEPVFQLTERPRGNLWLCSTRKSTPSTSVSVLPMITLGHDTTAAAFHEQQTLPAGKRTARRRSLFQDFLSRFNTPASAYQKMTYQRAYVLQGDAYLEGLDSERAVVELSNVAREHPEFFLAAAALPLAEQLEAMRTMRKHFKKNNLPEAWGVLRAVGSRQLKAWLQDEALVQSAFKALEGTKEPLTSALPLPQRVGDIFVMELLSQYELNREGLRMSHCVAGYGPSVSGHRCRIVSFRGGPKSTDCATGEWVFAEDRKLEPHQTLDNDQHMWPLQLSLVQLQTFGNKAPNEALVQAEMQVRQQLNEWLYLNPLEGWELLRPGEHARTVRTRSQLAVVLEPVVPRRAPEPAYALEAEQDIPF